MQRGAGSSGLSSRSAMIRCSSHQQARMGYVRDFWRAVEGTRLPRYTPSLSSLLESIPRQFKALAVNSWPTSLKALA